MEWTEQRRQTRGGYSEVGKDREDMNGKQQESDRCKVERCKASSNGTVVASESDGCLPSNDDVTKPGYMAVDRTLSLQALVEGGGGSCLAIFDVDFASDLAFAVTFNMAVFNGVNIATS